MPYERTTEPLKAERIQSRLKAERIQERLKAERIQTKLEAERVQELLAEVPGWALDGDGEALVRTYHLPSLRASGLFVQLVLEVGEQIDYVPDVDVRYLEVTVRISTAEGESVGELDFRVARVLDSRL